MPDVPSSASALIRRQIGALWTDGDLDVVDEIYSPDVVDHMPIAGQAQGLTALKAVVAAFRQSLPELKVTVHRILEFEDRAVDLWTMDAAHAREVLGAPASERPVRFSGIDMVRAQGGRIQELWHVEELHHLLAETQGEMERPPMPTRGADEGLLTDPAAVHDIARRHIVDLWGEARLDLAEELYAPDVVDQMPAPGQSPGIPGLIEALVFLRRSLPDLKLHLHELLIDGGFALDRWTITATHTGAPLFGVEARGRPVSFNGMDIIRVNADRRITDIWHVEELFQLQQML